MSQVYFVTGRPDINPFKNYIMDDPMLQGSFRQFHQLPTYGYADARKKFQDHNTLYYENSNNTFKPIQSFESLKRKQSKHIKTFMQDATLPTGITSQLPTFIDSSIKMNVGENVKNGYRNKMKFRVQPYARVN